MIVLLTASGASAQNINSISSQLDFDLPETAEPVVDDGRQPASVEEEGQVESLVVGAQEKAGPKVSLLLLGQSGAELDTNPGRIEGGSDDLARFRSDFVALASASWNDFTLGTTALLRNDDFAEGGDNDLTVLLFENRATYTASSIQPYVAYTPIFVYGDLLSDYLLTAQEVGGGVGIPLWQKSGAQLGLEANYTYRFATIAEFEGHRPYVKLSYAQPISGGAKFVLEGSVRPRIFTGGASDGREDLNLLSKASVSVPLSPALQLQLNAEHEYNNSNRDGGSYSVWDIGPKLVLLTSL